MIIGIDFDGTIVEHAFPLVGKAVPHALRVMKRLLANDHQLILWTMRSDIPADSDLSLVRENVTEAQSTLDDALAYLMVNDVGLFGVNENPDQDDWSSSPKAYCHIYIDDAALGCPLMQPVKEKRPFVDWLAIEQILAHNGYFQKI
tara:strand:+ start:1666 stop:2103 length:438 start_codon:yes stop_codon:yes gene_type:complete